VAPSAGPVPVRRVAPAAVAPVVRPAVKFGQVGGGSGHRIVVFGPGGIGKTTLAAALPGPVANTVVDGKRATSIEGYGFGKGYGFVFDTFLPLLADLDRHSREGRNVVLICHDCTATVPNPAGEDWLRYEPRLQSPNSGKASIRLRVREWADHVLFLGYDVDVSRDGKGRGAGTRTVYTTELPHCMAKSRSTQDVIPLGQDGRAVWAAVIR